MGTGMPSIDVNMRWVVMGYFWDGLFIVRQQELDKPDHDARTGPPHPTFQFQLKFKRLGKLGRLMYFLCFFFFLVPLGDSCLRVLWTGGWWNDVARPKDVCSCRLDICINAPLRIGFP